MVGDLMQLCCLKFDSGDCRVYGVNIGRLIDGFRAINDNLLTLRSKNCMNKKRTGKSIRPEIMKIDNIRSSVSDYIIVFLKDTM
jgi:hypothetical protein